MVVLIHGLGGRPWWMAPLGSRLRSSGFRTEQFCYSSYRDSIATHAERLVAFLQQFDDEPCVHVVAHSMGSVVLRAALAETAIPNLGRFVFLAPPSRGTPIARVIAKPLGRVFKTIAELSDDDGSFVNSLPPQVSSHDVGIVAAKFDILVPLASTQLVGQQDHCVVYTTHNLLPVSAKAARAVTAFLRVGRFRADSSL